MIDDFSIDEFVRVVINPEFVFCKNHNLFIYFKFIIIIFGKIIEKKDSDSENFFNNKNDFSEIENKFKKDFR